MGTNRRLALLIDGDNAQAALLPQMVAEVSKHGTITIRRVYGDWSGSHMNSWKEILHLHALRPAQQFSYTKGKNATDIGLIIDAMDMLHDAGIDGFCIASSDSDYTPLVTRIRGQNLFALGIGRKTTPNAFVEACDVFVFTDDLPSTVVDEVKKEVSKPIAPKKTPEVVAQENAMPKALKKLFREAFDSAVQGDGWAHLGNWGHFLRQKDAEFDPRTYGHKQLLQLVQAYPGFIKVRKSQTNGGQDEIYIRLKVEPPKPK